MPTERRATGIMGMDLKEIRVVALTRWAAGPVAGQIPGEWGADVGPAERVGAGGVTRANAPFYKGESLCCCASDRDKRSVTLNIAKLEGLKTTRNYEERRCCLNEIR